MGAHCFGGISKGLLLCLRRGNSERSARITLKGSNGGVDSIGREVPFHYVSVAVVPCFVTLLECRGLPGHA